MTPRPYPKEERKHVVDAGRDRILAAASEVLNLDDLGAFSLDAVARRAGVTRMTVYNHFGSKGVLLGEVFDLLVERDAFSGMPALFESKDLGAALDGLVGILGRFYDDNRALMLKMVGITGLDPDLDKVLREKNLRRRRGIEAILDKFGAPKRPAVERSELVSTLDVLLSFHTFNSLAGPERTPAEVVPHVRRMIRGILGTDAAKPAKKRVR
jgi:AcrR family transcriptional regulator